MTNPPELDLNIWDTYLRGGLRGSRVQVSRESLVALIADNRAKSARIAELLFGMNTGETTGAKGLKEIAHQTDATSDGWEERAKLKATELGFGSVMEALSVIQPLRDDCAFWLAQLKCNPLPPTPSPREQALEEALRSVIQTPDDDSQRTRFGCTRKDQGGGDERMTFYMTDLGMPERQLALYRNEAEALFLGLARALLTPEPHNG